VNTSTHPFGVRRSRRPIAVVGATGRQGKATVRALRNANAPVRALTRRADSDVARALVELGADLVAADTDDPESLRTAFTGVDAVFAMTTSGYDRRTDLEVRYGHAIADAAVAASVPRVVYSSVGGAERRTGIPHFDSKRDVEEYEALPISVLDGNADQRAMFEWFAHLPAFRADFAGTRALAPGTKTFKQWLETRPDL
jgi:nucleoside-diphosphate-sugar epimerase